MSVGAFSAAKRVCELRGWTVTNLEIQKILYVAHMLALGRSNGARPLVSSNFEAWDYGPVLPIVYHRAKAFGSEPVQNVFQIFPDIAGTEEDAVIKQAVAATRDKTPGQLVAMTHWDGGAWAKNYSPSTRGGVIPNSDILEEYRKRVG